MTPTPSPVDCSFVQITVDSETYSFFNGEYSALLNTSSGDRSISWENRDDSSLIVYHESPYWILINISGPMYNNTALVINDTDYKPPEYDVWQELTYVDDITETIGDDVTISFECSSTAAPSSMPSSQPTNNPTQSPTPNDAPYWTSCENTTNFINFIVSDATSYSVYWDEPIAMDSSGETVTVESDEYEVGDQLPFGPNTITYTGTDNDGATIQCSIEVYVLKGSDEDNYDTCLSNNFVIDVIVNSTFDILDADDIEITTFTDVEGKVSDIELNNDGQNCYVQMTVVSVYEDALDGGGDSDGNVFNILEDFEYWGIIIIILFLWIICLTIILIKCVCLRKEREYLDSQKLLSETAAEAGDASIFAGVADRQMMRKATLTGGAVVGGLHSTQSREEHPIDGNVEMQRTGSGQSNARASLVPDNDSIKVPTSQGYWQRELDYLGAKGYTDEKRCLKLLIKNAVKYAGKVDAGATAAKVEKVLDKEREEEIKATQAKNKGIQKEWNRQSKDDLNAPQANIAPPTMSSLVDSSNVLLDDDENSDDEVLKGFTTKGGDDEEPKRPKRSVEFIKKKEKEIQKRKNYYVFCICLYIK